MRLAEENDLPALKSIYSTIGAAMRAAGNPQWNIRYPEMDTLLNDVVHRQLWILEKDDRLLGALALIFGPDETYQHIENGSWLNDEPYAAIHRLFVHPDARRKRWGRYLLAFCDEEVLRHNVYNLRIDTHAQNTAMQALVCSANYTPTGTIIAKDGLARLAYQKVLSPASQAMP